MKSQARFIDLPNKTVPVMNTAHHINTCSVMNIYEYESMTAVMKIQPGFVDLPNKTVPVMKTAHHEGFY